MAIRESTDNVDVHVAVLCNDPKNTRLQLQDEQKTSALQQKVDFYAICGMHTTLGVQKMQREKGYPDRIPCTVFVCRNTSDNRTMLLLSTSNYKFS